MEGKWKKYLTAFKNADQIVEGIKIIYLKKNTLKLLLQTDFKYVLNVLCLMLPVIIV